MIFGIDDWRVSYAWEPSRRSASGVQLIMKLGAGLAVLALFFAVISADGISPPPDPFLDQHAGAVAKNIYGAFSIRFTDERRAFHAREPIEIELVYERGAQFTDQPTDGPWALSLTQAQFDRAVAAPLRIVDSKFDDHIPGPGRSEARSRPAGEGSDGLYLG